MKKFKVYGTTYPKETAREKEHKKLARLAAEEGMILLKNDGVLPLKSKSIALYGPGSRRTVKGGSGSGDVRERGSVTIEEGLKNAGFTFPTTLWMDRFEDKYQSDIAEWKNTVNKAIKGYSAIHTMDMFIKISEFPKPNPSCTPVFEDELTDKTDTAVYVLSRQAGEGKDRRLIKGDWFLSVTEEKSLELLSKNYKNLILVLNCGGVIDLSILDRVRIDAVIFYGQAGMSGGDAFARLISGEADFSGKLTDTWACNYNDYPSSDTYSYLNGDLNDENYYEGIYVGYRYFSSFDVKPRFPFGYGLSYTSFDYKLTEVTSCGTKITVCAEVKNTGTYPGKETLQLYLSKPHTEYDCERYALVAFAKTEIISPLQAQKKALDFDLCDFAIYDEEKECFVLPKGEYVIYLGTRIDKLTAVAKFKLSNTIITEHAEIIPGIKPTFKDAVCNKHKDEYCDESIREIKIDFPSVNTVRHERNKDKISPELLKKLSVLSKNEKASLCVGGGYKIRCYNNVMGAAGRTCTGLLKKGIPNIVMSDGPAGLNVTQSTAIGKEGFPRFTNGLPEDWRWGWLEKFDKLAKKIPTSAKTVYRYMTAWPNATMIAQTWNTQLAQEIGTAIGIEMLEIGVSVWLAPGLNIHRNPLCGRNFEYYSEDPIISGEMAAAVTRGVQGCGGVGVCAKHFCCNNQEDNRMEVSENLSQRALREIYLKAFRTAISGGIPWTVMSSYNKVNGVYVCNNKALLTGVLRNEWGFDGTVMSDWNAVEKCSYATAINAGNDLIMPGTKQIVKAIENDKEINESALTESAARVLKLIFGSDTCKEYREDN